MTAVAAPTIVEMRDINVAFGGVHAVRDVTIDLHAGRGRRYRRWQWRGQVDADARAVRCPSGGFRRGPRGREDRQHHNPRDAKAYNIETIYQTLALADNVDAPGNVFLGREITTRLGSLDDSSMEAETRKVMGRLNPNFTNFTMPVRSLSGGQRQAIAIARAVHFNARVMIMDEPTAALGPMETAQVRNLIRQLKEEGIGIFLISHDIHDVFDLSDRISVMYHGRIVDTVAKDSVTPDEVVSMIILGKRPDEATEKELEQLELHP